MARHKVRILFEPEHACPPVYVCGSFTIPPWIPVLMQEYLHGPEGKQKYAFVHEMEVEEGRWEYKIRIGESDWICDDTAPKVINDQGIVNNLLVVEPQDHVESMMATVNPFVPSSGRSISWELVKKDSAETDDHPHQSRAHLPKEDAKAEVYAEPAEYAQELEAPPPMVIDCHVAQTGISRSSRAINIKKRNSSAGLPYLGGGPSEPSLGNVRLFSESLDSESALFPRGMERSHSVADIDRVRYIMAMPREDGSSEPPSIMAYQGSQIMQLTPDYMNAVPIAADDAVSTHPAPFVSHSRFSSDLTASTGPREESFDSIPCPTRQSEMEERVWPIRRDSLDPERERQEIQKQKVTQMTAAYWNHRANCMEIERTKNQSANSDGSVPDRPNSNHDGHDHPVGISVGGSADNFDPSEARSSKQQMQFQSSHGPCYHCGFDERAYRRLVLEEPEPAESSPRQDHTWNADQLMMQPTNSDAPVAKFVHPVGDGAVSTTASVDTAHEAAGQTILMKIGAWLRSLFACFLCRK